MTPTHLFYRLRWQLLSNNARLLLDKSMVRVVTILVCSLIIWGLLFAVSWQGFYELRVRWRFDLGGQLLAFLFDMMFFALTVMLIFSTAIILYSSLFSAAESGFLLSSPIPADHIFRYKFQGAIGFSSWAFVLLGSPILLAYGLEVGDGAPWYFYVMMPLFFVGFILLPGCLGAILVLLLVNFLPSRKRHAFWLMVGLATCGLVLLAYWVIGGANAFRTGTKAWFESIISDLSSLGTTLVPIHWISLGFKSAALGEWEDMLYYLLLIWSNGLMIWLVTIGLARLLYRRGYNRVATGGDWRRRYGGAWLDNSLSRLLFFLDPQTRLLIIKDFRTFRRDPAQWFQVLIFMGLVVLYFGNVRRFYRSELDARFQNAVSLLTLFAVAFLTCAYTGRFIFPMLSLEGRKFWILGLLPLDRERLLWGKFAFSALWCLWTSLFVVILSDVMLGMPWVLVVMHMATAVVLALGLSGLSVGLGACGMPNFRETDPSKIAAGFGGTLNLVAGLMFLLGVVALIAGPFHLVLGMYPERLYNPAAVPWWAWASAGVGLIYGGLGIWLPMRAGSANLRRMEF